jgi:Immunoglobulin I-set domain
VLSRVLTVIRKHFTEHPYSRSVELERQVELRCLAPEGIPPPEISWMRNGVPIDPKKETNFIISSEGHLLIVQARLVDMGNYTCVVENVAGKRTSDTALLTVVGKLSILCSRPIQSSGMRRPTTPVAAAGKHGESADAIVAFMDSAGCSPNPLTELKT